MKFIYLVRHGQTDANKKKLWVGARSLYKLNRDGRLEAMEAGSKLRELDLKSTAIYASPVERAFQSAQLIASKLNLPIIPVPNLSEMFFGDVDTMNEDEFKQNFPVDYEEWTRSTLGFSPPNGESGERFYKRATSAIEQITYEADTRDVIIVTHSGIIKMFMGKISGADLNKGWRDLDIPEAPSGSITKFSFKDGKFMYVETISSENSIDG